MLSNISNNIQIIAISQLLILAYIAISKKNRSLDNTIFFSFLVLNALLFSVSYFYNNGLISRNEYPGFFYLFRSLHLVLGPLLYLFIKSKCYPNYKLRIIDFYHASSFIILFLFFVIQYIIRLNQASSNDNFEIYNFLGFQVFWSFFISQLLVYIVLSFRVLFTYKNNLEKEFSNIEGINFGWQKFLLSIYLLHWFFDSLPPVLYLNGIPDPNWYSLVGIFSIITLLIFTTLVIIKGSMNSHIFVNFEEQPKYAHSPLSDTECKKYLKDLVSFVTNSKLYLDPNLKLTDLSQNLGIPEKQISQLLNQKLGKNFFDFINEYRVNEVKDHIANNSNNGKSKTVLEIALMSGFNSKTAFNRAFKKITGNTPSQYKSSLN